MDEAYEEARYNRGKAYLLAGKYQKAITDFSAIIQQNTGDISAYSLRAQAYRAVGNEVAAQADERRAKSSS